MMDSYTSHDASQLEETGTYITRRVLESAAPSTSIVFVVVRTHYQLPLFNQMRKQQGHLN